MPQTGGESALVFAMFSRPPYFFLGPSARCQLEQHLPRAPLQPLPRIRARVRHAAPFSPPQGRGRLAPARPPKWHCPDGCQLLAVCAPTPRRDRRAPRGCRLGLATSHRHHTVVGARPASADSRAPRPPHHPPGCPPRLHCCWRAFLAPAPFPTGGRAPARCPSASGLGSSPPLRPRRVRPRRWPRSASPTLWWPSPCCRPRPALGHLPSAPGPFRRPFFGSGISRITLWLFNIAMENHYV